MLGGVSFFGVAFGGGFVGKGGGEGMGGMEWVGGEWGCVGRGLEICVDGVGI